MKVFFVVVVVLTIISLTEGGKKEKPDKEARKAAKAEKKCNKFIKKYEGCLKKGFKSTLGCGTGDDGEDEDDNADIGCWDKADREKKGVGYLGSQSTTRGGHTCQKWTAQSPQEHGYTLSDYPDKGLGDHNYCRNPGEKYTDVWCYTTTTDKRWDWCDVPTCSAAAGGWSKHDGKYLGGYSAGVAKYDTLEQAQAECVKRTDCGGITYETSGSKKYTLRKGADLRDSPSAEISYKLLPKLSGAWTQIPGGLTRISKGKSGVWGVNSADSIYKLNADGKSWTKIAGGLVQVASGAAVWGVNKADSIYKYLGDNKWQNMPGRLTNVDVSDNGNVWGINRAQNIYRWLGSSWQNIAGKAIQVSVGMSGVWVVNAANNIYYRVGTRGDPKIAGSKWVNVPGKLKWIASGKDIVVGVNALNDIYYRDGISDATPTGTNWVKINGKLSQIDVFDDEVVGTNPGSNIFRSPYTAPTVPVLAGQRNTPLTGLKVGDIISFSAIYSKSAARFGINIKDKAGNYLFRLAFRLPTDPTGSGPITVMNSRKNDAWQGELRAPFPKFEDGKEFTVMVSILEDKYVAYFNGDLMPGINFPHRQDRANAVAFELWGGAAMGANGVPIMWNKITKEDIGCWSSADREQKGSGYQGSQSKTRTGRTCQKWTEQSPQKHGYTPSAYPEKGLGDHNYCRNPAEKYSDVWCYTTSTDTRWEWCDVPTCKIEEVEEEGEEEVNILSKDLVATQNNVGWNGQPSRALDGNTNGQWSAGTCTHTSSNTGNWWKVKLDQTYKVNKVVLYNREDCCQPRINLAKVFVGSVYCGEVTYKAGQSKYEIACGGAVGGGIKVVQPYNYLTLCEVEAFGEPTDEAPLKNVAAGMPAWQSSVGWGGVASRGNDRRISGTWNKGTCTHSANANFNQWRVDLLDHFDVDSVVIYNRMDCCQNRLNGAKVYVDDTLCGAVEWAAGKTVYRIDCNGASGSKVRVTQDGQYLTLCEVQVLAKPSEDLGALINIADDGTATQSTVGWNGVATRAIDGNIASKYADGSCSHTGNVNNGWWNLEFPEPVPVSKVVIYNRKDCCQNRINGVTVYADDLLCGRVNYVDNQDVYKVGCSSDLVENVVAKNIRIKAADKQFLTLCEVKVLSDPTVEVGEDHLVNLAYQKPTSQSSTGWGGVPGRAVDGKESGQWSKGTCTHTAGAGWWMVDMKDNYAVEKVWIKNRIDCCSDRIDGVKVYVGDFLCGTIKYDPIKYAYEVLCEEGHGVVGQTVKIVNDKTYLTLCEVKVWGPKEPVIEDMASEDEVVGDKSPATDDATSVASCPVGKVVTYCEVATGNVGKNSDGALVNAKTGADCVAHNGWGGQGVIAKAVCSENEQIGDPCNGPKLLKYKHLYDKGSSPSLECPAGYEAVLCNAHSYWFNQLTNKGISDKGVIPDDKPCAVPNCNDANWCDVSLVCNLMDDLDAYAAKVCPDCGGWNCGEGEECEMVDADDDSGNKVPACAEKQTGCDVDRCGDHGECEAVGADDYTCDCEDGFEFDENAGTCMPKHSKYRTVYGDKAIGDDAHSYASCREGEKVMRCHTFGAPSAADGVTITTSNGIARCEARASNSKKFPIMAVAYCGDDSILTDPCTQDEIHGIEYRNKADKSPSVSCPGGYVMESCIFHSPWSQQLTDENKARINSIGAVDINDDGSCSMDNCLKNPASHQWCKLTAVCKKLTGSEYIKAACPTCDDVRCPEGQECQMVKELPVCLPRIPGGCEEDKCGKGECQEDGPNYKCLCDEGYKFDGATCADVDECAEEPCGNGECTNTPGSYTCDCSEGYELVHGTCEDINECLDSPCDDTERCSNVEGSYICDCLDTFVKDSKTKECVCADGYENQDGECVDIDECEDDPCGENEDCVNEVGNYHCECKEGTEKGKDGVCQGFKPIECGIKPKKAKVKGFKGMNVNVKLVGEKKKTFKKYATIVWERNNEPWKPKDDGKDKLNGFVIRNFDVDDVGVYVASIYIEQDDEISKCEVEVEVELVEGSVTLKVENEDDLMKPQKAGKELKIKCDLDLDNVKLDDPKNPDNVNWYRVTEDGDELLDDSDTISIERGRGVYQLVFLDPTPDDTGTYRCEFDQMGMEVSSDVTIEVV